ncbi:MAG: transcription termination factor NusA [Chloroflexota bacterium]|nr:transcription termination factor NusA [Chloroflexota bacterium]
MKNDLFRAFEQVCEDRNLPQEVVLEAIEAALVSAYKRNFGSAQNITAEIDPQSGQARVYAEKKVVEEVHDERFEVTLDEARKMDKEATVGGTVIIESTPRNFGRIAAQAAKQVILQRIREAEREALYEDYVNRKGELINGTVQNITPEGITLNLGQTEAFLPRSEQMPNEHYELYQRVQAYVLDVHKANRGPQIIVSRTHRNLLRRLFELEVPEIFNGTVEIKGIAREAGSRSKVAVAARQEGVDPVGSCVGMRGVRIKSIVKALSGEKIDVIEWSRDTKTFIANALNPAKVSSIELPPDAKRGRTATVVVPGDQLSLAIGRGGQNARLAAKLTGWRIDIKSVSEVAQEMLGKAEEVEIASIMAGKEDILARAKAILEGGGAHTTEELRVLEETIKTTEAAMEKAEEEALISLKRLGLSTRIENLLKKAGMTTITDVLTALEKGEEELLSIKGFGAKSLEEVLTKLRAEDLMLPVEEEAKIEVEEEKKAEVETKVEEPIEAEAEVEEEAEAEVEAEVPEEGVEAEEALAEGEERFEQEQKPKHRKRRLVYDEKLGKYVVERQRKPSRRREEWKDYVD